MSLNRLTVSCGSCPTHAKDCARHSICCCRKRPTFQLIAPISSVGVSSRLKISSSEPPAHRHRISWGRNYNLAACAGKLELGAGHRLPEKGHLEQIAWISAHPRLERMRQHIKGQLLVRCGIADSIMHLPDKLGEGVSRRIQRWPPRLLISSAGSTLSCQR